MQSYYPAAAPPDFIGVDIYDGNSSQNLTFSGFVAAANFATSKGVPISCGEWGMCTSVLYDDPRWVDLAHEFFTNPTAAVARYSGLNLYRAMSEIAGKKITAGARWPKSVHAFGNELRQIAPQLRLHGLSIKFERKYDARLVILRSEGNPTSVA